MADSDNYDSEAIARHELAHDLQSLIRGIAIYTDLLALSLQSPSENIGDLEKYPTCIAEIVEELSARVDLFAASDQS